MKKTIKAAVAALTLSVPLAHVTQAAVLDQFQLDGSEQNQAIHSVRPVGQTFTAGLSGQLESIELSLFESGDGGDLFLEVLDFSGGDIAAAPILGTVSKGEGDLGPSPLSLLAGSVTATLFDLTGLNISVMAGDALAFRLTTPRVLDSPTNIYAIRTSIFTDQYADGAYFVGTNFTGGDAAFKVSISPVPLPAGAVLLATGLAGLLPVMRRRKTRMS